MHFDDPQLTPTHLARVQGLNALLKERIEVAGSISFADYMQAALYDEQFGYYNRDDFVLGRGGDFVTAPVLSPLFACCFAKQCDQIFNFIGGDILEIGAGSGHFAADLLNAVQHAPTHYFIYEISPVLRHKQKEHLQQHCPEFFSRVIWIDHLPQNFKGAVIANEVLDALPVHCFTMTENGIHERCVTIEDNQLTWQTQSPNDYLLLEKLQELHCVFNFSPRYCSEINLSMLSFLEQIVSSISEGMILFADYGYGRREYYHPERIHGTLTCFYRHHRHHDPFILPGLQDITAHVDFSSVIDWASTLGCTLEGYTSQAAFLLNCGLTGTIKEDADEISRFETQQAIKILTLPTEMGERIKVMALGKNLPSLSAPWLGFHLHDRSREL